MTVASHPALWPSPWPAEDGGPLRQQVPHGAPGLGLGNGDELEVVSRFAIASTMTVLRDPGEVYLLGHSAGEGAVSWVEQVDARTLATLRRSPDLPGGPVWPGGIAAHANGSLYVVFGRHAHRLSSDLEVIVSVELPRDRPYNSFVVLPDGCLALKDFGGARPGKPDGDGVRDTELLVLEPDALRIVGRCTLPEASIARLSADGADVYVVGDTSLLRVRWDGTSLVPDADFCPVYRTLDGQTYGWDAVLADGAAWFLDNGAGSDRYAGSFRGVGISSAPLHLVRVGLADGSVQLTEICGLPNGLIANPPAIDVQHRVAVGYDSSNGVVAAFRFDERGVTESLWTRSMLQAAHPLLFPDTGELVLFDFDPERNMDQVVVLRIETGEELARADTGSPVQSVVFGSAGWERDLYICSFATISRVSVRAPQP